MRAKAIFEQHVTGNGFRADNQMCGWKRRCKEEINYGLFEADMLVLKASTWSLASAEHEKLLEWGKFGRIASLPPIRFMQTYCHYKLKLIFNFIAIPRRLIDKVFICAEAFDKVCKWHHDGLNYVYNKSHVTKKFVERFKWQTASKILNPQASILTLLLTFWINYLSQIWSESKRLLRVSFPR